MGWEDLYDDQDRMRLVDEPVKRVSAPARTPFERDRARVVHSASLRRLAAKTQVVGPQTDDFARNRLTHSLEVAQVARDIAHPLGCHPDIVETAALAHDLGHPPFGHNGETALDELASSCGGFEGNAQTLRILTRMEAKSWANDGHSVGLNLTRATLDACTKYPWRRERPGSKFGVYDDDLPVFTWMRTEPSTRRCVEAQIMDFGDDVAYSVHDLEDGIVAGHVDPRRIDTAAVWEVVREWYLPQAADAELDQALAQVQQLGSWPSQAYDGSRAGLSALKNMTSDLVGVFCGEVHEATRRVHGDSPMVRYRGDLVIPAATRNKIAVLKGIAAHYVMRAPDRLALMERQRCVIAELFAVFERTGAEHLDAAFRADFEQAGDDPARVRVWIDQIASLTDDSCLRL
ncbi:MAG TPA: deoxyguanosinetriphosphate triphosphohydrolase, partial [Marmoricola sp.]|nr:deoxyguanosinetriphosphate triphosphohydrolase [Marmoricola sp.]